MSLPDTVFIFVLALIIFGPKKLPEIGRQIGKLVGEFRRASNEFKFQIEEELRQADILDKRAAQPEISRPVTDAHATAESTALPPVAQEATEFAETLPVGQYPNIATLDVSGLDRAEAPACEMDGGGAASELPQSATENGAVETYSSTSHIEITAAPGSQPRTAPPFAAATMTPELFESVVPADRPPAQAEAEITHG